MLVVNAIVMAIASVTSIYMFSPLLVLVILYDKVESVLVSTMVWQVATSHNIISGFPAD
jgi:hypothetical protein